jgi:hypothetical protein
MQETVYVPNLYMQNIGCTHLISNSYIQLAHLSAEAMARQARVEELERENAEKAEALSNLQLVIAAAEAGV